MRAGPLLLMILWGASGGAGGGGNKPTHFTPPMGAVETGQPDAGAESASVVVLPFRQPNDTERSKLDEETAAFGFQAPWLRRDQVAISIQYSITNLGMRAGKAQIYVDGSNEFTTYDRAAIQAAAQAAAMDNEEAVVLPLLQTIPVELAPGETKTGTIREDDFAEAELDLDAIGRWMAPPAAVLINASEVNSIGLENVPPGVVVPAMFRISITFTATAHMRLDYLVRVRDKDGQLLGSAGGDAFAPNPPAYVPPVMAAP